MCRTVEHIFSFAIQRERRQWNRWYEPARRRRQPAKPQQDEHTSSSKMRKRPGIQRKLMLGSPCQSQICVDNIKITIWFDLKSEGDPVRDERTILPDRPRIWLLNWVRQCSIGARSHGCTLVRVSQSSTPVSNKQVINASSIGVAHDFIGT